MSNDRNPHDLLAQYTYATPEGAALSSSPDHQQQPVGSSRAQQQPAAAPAGPSLLATAGGRVEQAELGWRLEPFEAGFSEGFAAGQRLARSLALGSGIDIGEPPEPPVDWAREFGRSLISFVG